MALQGTIKDFGLGDIFQLIGIQRKTGVLTLESGSDSVTVMFLEGQIVGADTRSASVEDLLGAVLVRTGRITDAQLNEALKTQKRTLQRLGHILVRSGAISAEALVEALRVQSLQIVYRLFRWKEGSYHFHTAETLEYDDKHFTPISADTILMEGARMVDEWPIIERRIKSPGMVVRLTEAGAGLDLQVESLLDDEGDLDFGFAFGDDGGGGTATAVEEETGVKLSQDEREVMVLVDGTRTVEEINDHSSLGEFDTFRILSEMMTRNLLEEAPALADADAAKRERGMGTRVLQGAVATLLAGMVLTSILTLSTNPLTPWRLAGQDQATTQLRSYAALARLERIHAAIQVYFLDRGSFPETLDELSAGAYLRPPDLLDPWGRPFLYAISSGGYQVSGLDAAGEPTRELTLGHTFSATQRMLLELNTAP